LQINFALESPLLNMHNHRSENQMTSSLDGDPRWQLVQRIVASSGFMNSSRLSAFLLHVSKQTLLGEGASLNERTIGEAVFERSPGYDPRDDNIVRSHASRLRLRLQDYFREEGASESLRVSIPRGSYVPVFESAESAPSTTVDETPTAETATANQLASPAAASSQSRATIALICLVLLGAAIGATALYLRHRSLLQETPSHKLWAQVFRNDQQTIIVPADSSLVIARLMVGHPIRLQEYAGGLYRQATDCDKPCDLRMVNTVESLRYTSMSDLEFAVKVSHIPEAIPLRTEIRFARDLELKDLKESNLIMAGSQEADPWIAAITGQMNFVVHDDPAGVLRVENRQPQSGEKSQYIYDPHDPQHRGLATIAFIPNLSGSGNLLVVQGFSLAGTQAAAEFVTNRRDIDNLFQSFAGNQARLPHFEILLDTAEVNGMASRPVVLAFHVQR
jgi:hypothetical protein